MILYHGSYLKIEEPNLTHSRSNVDFCFRTAKALNLLQFEGSEFV